MIKVVLLVVFISCTRLSYSQDYILSRQKQEKAYLYIENPLRAIVEGYSCGSVILTTNNGKINKYGCSYSLLPERYGSATIVLSVKKGNAVKKIKEIYIGVDSIPKPVAFVGALSGGPIKKGQLKAEFGIGAWVLDPPGTEITGRIKSFTIIIINKDSIVFSRNITGNTFDNETREAFESLQQDDTVIFTKILSWIPGNKLIALKPLEFSIIE